MLFKLPTIEQSFRFEVFFSTFAGLSRIIFFHGFDRRMSTEYYEQIVDSFFGASLKELELQYIVNLFYEHATVCISVTRAVDLKV